MNQSPLFNTLPAVGYDSSIYELASHIPSTQEPWQAADLRSVLAARTAWQKQQHELHVYYYRINQTLAYPLPVAARPPALPAGIPGRSWYPWLIWLLWTLEERWRTLHAAWRLLDDHEAGLLLQKEITALNNWQSFKNWHDDVGLPTGHIAGCLTYFLTDKAGWDAQLYTQAQAAAERLIEQDVWPWYQTAWAPKTELTPHDIHNIPVIALVRGAQLARTISSPHATVLEEKALATLRAWWHHRADLVHPHTEGTSYDGYLMDTFTEWIDGLPQRQALLAEGSDAFVSLARQWLHSTLPGRLDLHAPLSDVEPEMPFWMNCLSRMVQWYGGEANSAIDDIWPESRWLLQRIPAVRLPAASLTLALSTIGETIAGHATEPMTAPQEIANAVTLRTGWAEDDLLALIGVSRSEMSHLHNDGGHLILGWQRRFWITDPGYQQYRPGEERTFTVGVAAHNGPVIDEIYQSQRGAKLVNLAKSSEGQSEATLDLTACYEGLPPDATVTRTVSLQKVGPYDGPLVMVHDALQGFATASTIRTHWQCGTHLAWAFIDGWARLSDGKQALWIGTTPGAVEAMMMERHAGSRGPLTLIHEAPLPEDGNWRWFFCTDPTLSWTPPTVER